MTYYDIARIRLHNQHLAGAPFDRPEDAVGWLGAVQSQEYPGAKWGLAQRTNGLTDTAADRAFAEGRILRTHVMRPTWHFVTPADIRWMLNLTAPRVHAVNASYYRKFELDGSVFARTNALLASALQGGKQLTRSELAAALQQTGLSAATDDRLRMAYILMRAELDGVICSGALRGKQQTYALLEERASQARSLDRGEALAELARRFFVSHGPATVKDFTWWSGLAAADARAGLEMIKPQLVQEVLDGKTFWSSPGMPSTEYKSPTAHLLPAYDEYTIAYKDHAGVLDPQYLQQVIADNGIVIVIDGRLAGTWKRTVEKGAVHVALKPFTPLPAAEQEAVYAAVRRYGEFLGMPAVVVRT